MLMIVPNVFIELEKRGTHLVDVEVCDVVLHVGYARRLPERLARLELHAHLNGGDGREARVGLVQLLESANRRWSR